MSETSDLKPILIISASDSSGAAGMAVDIRVVNDLGCPVRCALTAVTVQGDTGLVSAIPVDHDNVARAIMTADAESVGIGAVKIGLITEPQVARSISAALLPLHGSGVPVILDPVIRSTPGSILASRGVSETLVHHLLPVTSIVTPNRDELDELAAIAGRGEGEEQEKASALISMGAKAVLVTGGDDGGNVCVDILYREGEKASVFRHPKIGAGTARGTGCTLSTAIAVNMGKGMGPLEAIESSIEYVTRKIENAEMVGKQRLLFPGKRKIES